MLRVPERKIFIVLIMIILLGCSLLITEDIGNFSERFSFLWDLLQRSGDFLTGTVIGTVGEIGGLLGKSVNTIWATYQRACGRKTIFKSENKYFLPISLFQNRSLSLMETIVLHLNQIYHLKNKEIASLLHTSHSSVAVLMKRAKDKNGH